MDNENITMEEEVQTPVEEPTENTPADEEVDDVASAFLGDDEEITEQKLNQIGRLIRTVAQQLRAVQGVWESTAHEFGLNNSTMKAIYTWNVNNRDELSPDATDEEKENYDKCNGIDKITEEEVENIFGKGHEIIGVAHTQTIDRIKSCLNEYIGWISCLKEYQNITRAYGFLQNEYDEQNIKKLQEVCDAETDPELKANQQKSIDMYHSYKYLSFLRDEHDERDINRIAKVFTDANKIDYWIKRTRTKLTQMNISQMFIPEIAQFEKGLDEKYHHLSGITLLYFSQLIVYCNCHDEKSIRRSKVIFMFNALDSVVRKTLPPDKINLIKENVCAMLDLFVDRIPKPETNESSEESST